MFAPLFFAFTLLIQLRFADGRPAAGLQVHVSQGISIRGECVTDAAGQCELGFDLEDDPSDPILYVRDYKFASAYGLSGTEPFLILFPDYLNAGRIAIVLGVPSATEMVLDSNPDGPPLAIWNGMPPGAATAAYATLAALPTITLTPAASATPSRTLPPPAATQTDTPAPTQTARVVVVTTTPLPPSPTPAPASGGSAPCVPGGALLLPVVALVAWGYRKRLRR